MERRQGVLELIKERMGKDRPTCYLNLVKDLGLSEDSACDCLKRLWRERLIEAAIYRPPRFLYRLEPDESIREIHFHLTRRGKERLRWFHKKEKKERSLWW